MENKKEFILNDYNRDTFINNIENFLYKVCNSTREVDEAMIGVKEIVSPIFNPMRYLSFTPIYAFEKFTYGKDEERLQLTPLLEREGCVISVMVDDLESNNPTDSMRGYEIILLDNMDIIAVPGYNIDIDVGDKTVNCKYLYLENNSLYNLKGKFDVMKFLLDLTEEIMSAYRLRGCTSLYDSCNGCPLQSVCRRFFTESKTDDTDTK